MRKRRNSFKPQTQGYFNIWTLISYDGSGLAVVLCAVVYASATFREDRVVEGSAYGFSIGQTHDQAFGAAQELKGRGEIHKILRISEARTRTEFALADLPEARSDNRWIMIVDPDFWNDSISLKFGGDSLVELYRFRFCCEMP